MHRRESEASRDEAAQDVAVDSQDPPFPSPAGAWHCSLPACSRCGWSAFSPARSGGRHVGVGSGGSDAGPQRGDESWTWHRSIRSSLIKQPAFAVQVARGYLLGTAKEIPFTVDPEAPALPANAPGSVGIKPEVTAKNTSPLDSWLQVLFGSQ
jgi:hypothetical protein